MILDFKFAVASDLHIALPETIWDHPSRFHLVELSIPAFERVLDHLSQVDIDFLLLPGDLTQHGEVANHQWLAERLAQLPYPVYVVPGNHDFPYQVATDRAIGMSDFAPLYGKFGYQDPSRLYYTCEVLPGVRLIALNSNDFDAAGNLIGRVDEAQLAWLESVLTQVKDEIVLVMIHHNAVEHLRGQSRHPWGQRYILRNASIFRRLLRSTDVRLVFTGHLHIQNIASRGPLYEITTGSLVSYPHPYRIIEFHSDRHGHQTLSIDSPRVTTTPDWPQLQETSLEWMATRSTPMMAKLLASPPFNLPAPQAERLAPDLKYFWASIAAGDAHLQFPTFPESTSQILERLNRSSAQNPTDPVTSDNNTQIPVRQKPRDILIPA